MTLPALRHCLVVLLGLLLASCATDAAEAPAVDLQARLEQHLREEVQVWTAEPRMWQLLRELNARNAAATDAQLRRLEAQWQEESAAESGETRMIDTVSSRFASNYLAEVVLRLGAAYRRIVLLERHDLVAAASEPPERYRLADEPVVATLRERPASPWVQDRRPAPGRSVRVALPLREDDAILGVLLLDIDVAKLPPAANP